MYEIGGYFELETLRNNHFMHSDGILVNSGRHAFEAILRSSQEKIRRLFLPRYTCDAMIQPIERLKISYEFYDIDFAMEISELPILEDGDFLVANNYFGLKDKYIKKLSKEYKSRLIADCSQAWYMPVIKDLKIIYSPRKFFGVPDGGIAYPAQDISTPHAQDTSFSNSMHLLKRIDCGAQAGYEDFKNSSAKLKLQPILRMSKLTEAILSGIDFEKIKGRRISNFHILAEALDESNLINVKKISAETACPMVYPYLTEEKSLRTRLISNNIFVAQYWPNVAQWARLNSLEKQLSENLIPLPIDQRYGEREMYKIISIINQ